MGGFSYIIKNITDKDKKTTSKREGFYYIKFANVGSGAILIRKGKEMDSIRTSTVKDIKVWDNAIIIETINSVYELELIMK